VAPYQQQIVKNAKALADALLVPRASAW